MCWLRNCVLACLLLTVTTSAFANQDEVKKASNAAEQARLEQEFADSLSDVVLVGRYSITTKDGEKASKPDRYEIVKVTKVSNGYWLFLYRKSPELVLPISLRVVWAADTPMITMTNETIPALGTFSTRLMFHGKRYAGTWQHGAVGGHMWGQIEKRKPVGDQKKTKGSKQSTTAK